MTLLEKAKAQPEKKRTSNSLDAERVELAVALLNDDVSSSQVIKTLGIATGSLQSFIASQIRSGVRAGIVKVSFNGR